MRKERVRLVNNFKEEDGPIIYWMSRDQRIHDNWALIFAQGKAIKRRQPLIILFCLQQKFLNATQRIYNFMLDGLKKVERSLNKLNIPFIILKGAPEKIILDFIESFKISNIIIDFSPLRIKREWIKRIHDQIQIPIFEVDTHNIIPCWEVSNKKEYAAYTIRSKIQKKLNQYLDQFPDVKKHPYGWNESYEKIDWENLKKYLEVSNNDVHDLRYNPGETEGSSILKQFLNEKLKLYNQNRN
ncbi:MAG: deoxyribodipyrimidine photo-lyase, partial [Candidatus Hodarchaeota archaeon]